MAETNYDDRIVVGGTSTESNPYTLKEGKTYTAAQYEGNGGAVYVESDGSVSGQNITFQNNCVTDSKGKGGAIFNGSGAVLTLNSATFTGNSTTGTKGQGGAICNAGTATLSGSTLSGNKATMGGAVFNNGGALEISGGTINDNSAKYGGAIQNFGGGTVNITGTVFSGNTAAADGGAIAHNAGTATITGATFTGNTARSSGGAIYNTGVLNLSNVTFSGNTAKSAGGAICNTGTVNMTGTVTLATASDEFCNTGALNWNLTAGPSSCGSMTGYQYLNNDGGTLTITVDDNQQAGSYTIAAGDLSTLDGKQTFTLTGIEGESTIIINGESVIYDDKKYTLATDNNGTAEDPADDNLVLQILDAGGGGEGGGSEDPSTLAGVLQLDSGTEVYDGGEEGETLSSTTSDENVILVQNGATLTISNYTLNKSGNCSSEDNSNFYAVNAVVAAKSAAKIYIDNSVLNSNAEGANGLFASGKGSTIYACNCTITSTKNSSRGLDATYEGTVIAAKLTINTSGDHCAALATDRGDGYISVTDSTLTTAGQGSPLIYSTGIIEVDNVTGTSTGSQIAGIEGLSTIRIKNSDLSGSGKKASEPVANGVIIYQSMSGDSTEGTATFEVADSTLKSAINGGAMFYITNTSAVITVQNTVLDFDSGSNYLLKAAGNDGSSGWGSAGSNGAEVVFTAIDQTLAGTVSVDGISSLDMYLVNSIYTGTFELDTTYSGNGGTDLYISADSTWIVTQNCTLQTLTAAAGANITDDSGKSVSIVNTSGETIISGTGDLTITVSAYTSATVEAPHTIKDFEIDRSAFEELYPADEPLSAPVITSCTTDGNRTAISWDSSAESEVVDIALNAAESSNEKLLVRTDDKAIELYSVPETYELSLKDAESSVWSDTTQLSCTAAESAAAIVSQENNIAELFFANVAGTWSSACIAQHAGSMLDWEGTKEYAGLAGKNKIADTFTGSSDANILFLTDDVNGDALFVDDIYTAFPDEQQSRIAQIDEIRAGAGDDVVDMTSQRFEYTGAGLTIRGGSGNDTIWANKGSNRLFGDAGSDRIVGASGDDVIAGGTGSDSMHGGGGNDIFCFCNNWGEDTVEQLSGGNVTLWFISGSKDNWDQATMTYTDGDNTVKVSGVSEITLKFGDDETAQYTSLVSAGCFMEESSDNIFETEQKGVLAVV